MGITRSIVKYVRSMNPAGRFLTKDTETGLWTDIGNSRAYEKTSQALRDGQSLRKLKELQQGGDEKDEPEMDEMAGITVSYRVEQEKVRPTTRSGLASLRRFCCPT